MNDNSPDREPSLLDYLKARLRFWKPLPDKFGIRTGEEGRSSSGTDKKTSEIDVKLPISEETSKFRFPWMAVSALTLALIAQRTFEPSPNRNLIPGLVLYGAAFILLIFAIVRKEWNLASPAVQVEASFSLKFRPIPLVIGISLSCAALYFFGGNKFSVVNISMWILAIITLFVAFHKTETWKQGIWQWIKSKLSPGGIQVKFNLGLLIIILAVTVVIFFRVYELGKVPSEPFSDHAEKILDVYDISQGQWHIFFPRNTGREALQMYLTLAVATIFGTGLTFLSLKIGTVICGLATLPYIYLLGEEFGSRRVGVLAMFFAGIAYWPNVISRVGLRFPLYPLFVAPTLYYLLRGLRKKNHIDFLAAGLFLGLGLHGYSPFRIMPFVVVAAFLLYALHAESKGSRKQLISWLSLIVIMSLVVFLPLLRYWVENPASFNYRAISRLSSIENPLSGPAYQVFFSNLWNALRMFNWEDGEIWVNSIPHRPALDVVSGALFLLGVVLVVVRYIQRRHWLDLFLLISIPLLLLPSILSLAYPAENPALNRAAGALVPVFLIVGLSIDGLVSGIQSKLTRFSGKILVWSIVILLAGWSSLMNYQLVFNKYASEYTAGAWNSSEMGAVIKEYGQTYGSTNTSWIVPFSNWVDTRLPGVWAGIPNRDFALWPDEFQKLNEIHGTRLVIVYPQDESAITELTRMFPHGTWSRYRSATGFEGKDFMVLFIPPGG